MKSRKIADSHECLGIIHAQPLAKLEHRPEDDIKYFICSYMHSTEELIKTHFYGSHHPSDVKEKTILKRMREIYAGICTNEFY
jgi:hypothetical protein